MNSRLLVGASAVLFSVVYLVSDVVELAQGGFSPFQLALTYAAEAALPLFVLGLYARQRPGIGALGLAGAVGYAYAYVFFTGTVLYAIVERTPDWDTLSDRLGAWIGVHSALMVVAGIAFGVAVARAGVLPRWTGVTLIVGMLLMALTPLMPAVLQVGAAGVRDLAFASMGWAVLRSGHHGDRPAAAAHQLRAQ
ncbi:hypothetical protein JIG36_09040 [Actinoplanes sp. LDG1-06]|uniref:Uncharacterized protein n=1 Tax=Paractinoplanes ovalisporus TaxID=2810368 RepID=A0ABS2A781_9ACTN|nr:hypothetical protein [Actinoplanes ovalisporus]MBM2615697.1 hypothetical protein [Actinoplanes ovalisporus]